MINNYNKLSIGKFAELQAIDINGMEEIDVQVAMIAILNEMTEDEVINLPLPEYQKLAQQTKFLTTPPTPLNTFPSKIKIGDRDFIVIKDIREMTAGQYIDYHTYLGFKDVKYLPHILSCFIIPKGEKYGDTKIEEIIELFTNELSILTAISISAFFLHKWESLTKATLIYLGWKMKRALKKEKNPILREKMEIAMKEITSLRNLIRNGDGLLGLYKLKN